MVLLNLKSEELKNQEEKHSKRESRAKNHQENIYHEKNEISIREALDKLTEDTPKEPIEHIMDSFILEYLRQRPEAANHKIGINHQNSLLMKQKGGPRPPPLVSSPQFKLNFEDDPQQAFSELNSPRDPGDGQSAEFVPALSFKLPQGMSQRSISSNLSISQPRKALRQKQSIFRTLKRDKAARKKVVVRSPMVMARARGGVRAEESTRNLKAYGLSRNGGSLQSNRNLSIKGFGAG